MTDKEKIREEIERRVNLLQNGDAATEVMKRVEGVLLAYNSILQFLDSLPEEPASEDLEEAAKEWAENHFQDFIEVEDDPGYWCSRFGFIAGAKWQKQQMMKDAVEIPKQCYDNHTQSISYCLPIGFVKDKSKLKIIIVKED